MIGLADVGNDVLTANRAPLTDAVHLLAPTTDLTSQYNQALYCLMGGLIQAAYIKQPQVPGAMVNAGFVLGKERYRYPIDLPKVAATGGPQCVSGLPNVRYLSRPPLVIADVGTNPARYGNEGILLNTDGLKQRCSDRSLGRRETPHRSVNLDEARDEGHGGQVRCVRCRDDNTDHLLVRSFRPVPDRIVA